MRSQRFLAGILLTLALGLGLVVGEAASSARFGDAVGDSEGAPDLTGVTVSHKAAGTASFEVGIANFSTLAAGESVLIMFDTDQTPTTGLEGFEYAVFTDSSMLGGGYAPVVRLTDGEVPGMAGAQATATGVTFTLPTKLIGQPAAFDFLLASNRSDAGLDVCGHGAHPYSLAVTVAAVQVPKPALTPKAGKVLSVRGTIVTLNTAEVLKPTKLASRLTIGGKQIKPLAGGNAWKVPVAARGKTGILTVQTWYGTSQKTATFRVRIR